MKITSGSQIFRLLNEKITFNNVLINHNTHNFSSRCIHIEKYHKIYRSFSSIPNYNFNLNKLNKFNKSNYLNWFNKNNGNKINIRNFSNSKINHNNTQDPSKINLRAKLTSHEDQAKNKSGWKEFYRLIGLIAKEKYGLALATSLLGFTAGVTMIYPYVIGRFTDICSGKGDSNTIFGLELNQFYWVLAGLATLVSICSFGRTVLLRVIGERVIARLRSKLYRHTVMQDAEFFDANRTGDIISRLGMDCLIVSRSITYNLCDGLRSLISLTAGLTMMLYTSLNLSLLMAITVFPIAIAGKFYGEKIRNISKSFQAAVGSLTKTGEERLSNIKTAQSYSAQMVEVRRYNSNIREIFNLGKRESIFSGMFYCSTHLAGQLTILATLIFGVKYVQEGIITVGDVTQFLMYGAYTASSVAGLTSFYADIMRGMGAASRLFEMMDRKPIISLTKGKNLSSARGDITFDHVSFAYPTRPGVTIFNDLNFTIQQGSNVCIVGPSGGGKSTIMSLLMRFYDPNNGSIKLNGHDIKEYNLQSLRRHIGVVAQEPVLFDGSIAENIGYGETAPGVAGRATIEQIEAAASRANCQFIDKFPQGLDTLVGARGTQLSGGQKQRIAIARALIRNPDIIILDEATSALDTESETAVNDALRRLIQGKSTTTISIAHRLSTIKNADHIIVLSPKGTVAEQGSFNELIYKGGALSQLLQDNSVEEAASSVASKQNNVDTENKDKDIINEEEENKKNQMLSEEMEVENKWFENENEDGTPPEIQAERRRRSKVEDTLL